MPKKPKYNEIACPKCKEPMAVSAEICPHCRSEFSKDEVAQRVKSHNKSIAGGCGCLVLVALIIAIFSATNSDKEEKTSATSSSPATESDDPAPGSATADLKAGVLTFHNTVFAALRPCDKAGERTAAFSTKMQSGNASVYEGYAIAKEQAEACADSSLRVGRIRIAAALKGSVRDAAESAQETCQGSATAKQMAAENLQEVFDGNMKPSQIEAVKQRAEEAQALTAACAMRVFGVAFKAGVDPKDLPK